MRTRGSRNAALAAGRVVPPLQGPYQSNARVRRARAREEVEAPVRAALSPGLPPVHPNRAQPAGTSYQRLEDGTWVLVLDEVWASMEAQKLRLKADEERNKMEKRKKERARRLRRERNGGVGAAGFRRRFANRGVEGKEGKNRKGKGRAVEGPPKRRIEDEWDGDRLVGRKGTFAPK